MIDMMITRSSRDGCVLLCWGYHNKYVYRIGDQGFYRIGKLCNLDGVDTYDI